MNDMHIKSIFILFTFFCLTSLGAQSSPDIVKQLEQSFLQKTHAPIRNQLSDGFSIAGNTQAGAIKHLDYILHSYPVVKIAYLSTVEIENQQKISVQMTKTDHTLVQTAIYTDSSGKILYVDLFDQLYGMDRYQKSRLRAKIPFENHNGSIILSVKINSFARPLRLLFDTGADGMAVSQVLAGEMGLKVTRENNASVVGGNMTIKVSDHNTIMLDTLVLQGQGIAIFPENQGTDGIIGNSLLKRFITQVDYDTQMLSLYDFGDYQYENKGFSVPIKMPAGLLITPGNLSIIEGKAYDGQFVFDTGAAYSVICFRPFVRTNKLLVSGFKPEYQSTTASMGMVSPTFTGKSYAFGFSNLDPIPRLPVTLMAGSASNENWQPEFDGSVGVRLISRYNFTVNLQRNEIFFSPNQYHDTPQDFVLGDYLLGWEHGGQLCILHKIGAVPTDEVLKEGTVVRSINGIKNEQLKGEPGHIESLQRQAKGSTISLQIMQEDQSLNFEITL